MVDAINDRGVHVLFTRRRDDHLLRASRDVRRRLRLAREEAGALEHGVDAEVLPRQLRGVLLRTDADLVAVDDEILAVDADLAREAAMSGVVFREVRVDRRVPEVVDRDDREVVLLPRLVVGAKDHAADAAVAVDGDSDGHPRTPENKARSARV